MFYFVPSRGNADDMKYSSFGSMINVLDTEDNVIEAMPAQVLYKSPIAFENAVRLTKGRFKYTSCPVRQYFNGVSVVTYPSKGLSVGGTSYDIVLNETDKASAKKFRALGVQVNGNLVQILRNRVTNLRVRLVSIAPMVKFSDYYVVPIEVHSWVDPFNDIVLIVFMIFNSVFEYLGNYMTGDSEVVLLCNSVDKSLAARLAFADEILYF